MVFVLAWTTGDASNLSSQSQYQVHFVYSSMSTSIITQSKFNIIIRCGTNEKVVVEWCPWSFGFMPLPFVALKSGASFVYGVILQTEWMLM
jgi:hypothetical protein